MNRFLYVSYDLQPQFVSIYQYREEQNYHVYNPGVAHYEDVSILNVDCHYLKEIPNNVFH